MPEKELGKSWADLRARYPEQKKQLDAGLLILLAGGIKTEDAWLVHTTRTWRVALTGVPTRWYCRCPQGREFGPVVGEFAGRPGRICKHICAVLLGVESQHWPGRPDNLLGFLERLAGLGQPELVAEVFAGPVAIPNGRGVKVVLSNRDEANGNVDLGLAMGRSLSGGLVRLRDGKLVGDYEKWAGRVKRS